MPAMSAHASNTLSYERVARAPAFIPRCAGCGYDLRGLEQPRCPECGLDFDPNALPPADIPWLKRGDLLLDPGATGGNPFVAYWRTVWLVLAQPRKLGAAVWQDVEVDAADAARFRWITIGVALGSVLATLLPIAAPLAPSVAAVLLLGLGAAAFGFFCMATARFEIVQFTAVWFAQEQRYRRLHDLCCAGLALAPLVPMTVLSGLILGWDGDDIASAALAMALLVVLAWWHGSLCYQIHGGRCRPGDAVLHALMLPFAWCMIAIVVAIFTLGLLGLFSALVG